ncbi:MAG: RNA ligase [Candidatus Asgardarchaeia archaeon]
MSSATIPYNLKELASDVLKTTLDDLEKMIKGRALRYMKFRSIHYLALRKQYKHFEEGTIIGISETGQTFVVRGFPSIKRILLLQVAVPQHFLNDVVVEEKMNGYNIRVISVENKLLAITRGGFICPYTTHRLEKLYGSNLNELISSIGEEYTVNGEVVGLENPYTRFYYPEASDFDFFIFDIRHSIKNKPIEVMERHELVSSYSLKNVPFKGIINKNEITKLYKIINELHRNKREGVVLKDPENRVAPLKYTTSFINLDDLRQGMFYFFDEGRSFLFSRILREAFMIYEFGNIDLDNYKKALGDTIIEPMLESIKEVSSETGGFEEFVIKVFDEEVINELFESFWQLKIPLVTYSMIRKKDHITLVMRKFKNTLEETIKILQTGISPID